MANRPQIPSVNIGLLILRVGLGVALMFHGWPKLSGGPAGWGQVGQAVGYFGIHSGFKFWGLIAACTEFFGGALLALGLLTRIVAFFLVCQMIVAMTFHLHIPSGPLSEYATGWSHPLENGITFLALIFLGAGLYSLDHMLFDRREPSNGVPPSLGR